MGEAPKWAPRHVPVLAQEVLDWLRPSPGETWVDATVGAGGHSVLLAECVGATGRVVGLDWDPTMLEVARRRLTHSWVSLVPARFDQLGAVLDQLGIAAVDGVLADLGVCSDQLDDPSRGLSFRLDGPLDMRLDPTGSRTAFDFLLELSEQELADLIYRYGEERYSRRIARAIVESRRRTPLQTTAQLADLVRRCVPREKGRRGRRFDPATRTFQALRIAVNDELGTLERFFEELPHKVRPGGRVGIISFHSLEDRLVKQAFRKAETWEPLTKKPIEARPQELQQNPRSRSAKLRVARRVGCRAVVSD
jgi:16S rRNA (cytosine1402-N4)-methyltransferase